MIIGPYLDYLCISKWILDYHIEIYGMLVLLLSAVIAFLTNLTQFLCLGKYSTITFQVINIKMF